MADESRSGQDALHGGDDPTMSGKDPYLIDGASLGEQPRGATRRLLPILIAATVCGQCRPQPAPPSAVEFWAAASQKSSVLPVDSWDAEEELPCTAVAVIDKLHLAIIRAEWQPPHRHDRPRRGARTGSVVADPGSSAMAVRTEGCHVAAPSGASPTPPPREWRRPGRPIVAPYHRAHQTLLVCTFRAPWALGQTV